MQPAFSEQSWPLEGFSRNTHPIRKTILHQHGPQNRQYPKTLAMLALLRLL
jgi:hypothetical protein